MPGYITKDIFLKTFTCPTLGWETIHSNLNSPEKLSLFDKFKMQEGIEVQDRARKLYQQGFLVAGNNPKAAKLTQKLLDNKNIKEIFEATFISDNFITKVDILKRENKGWKLIEIKSGTDDNNSEYLDDLAYTTMVVKMAGLDVVGSFLLLVSKDYRLGMSDDKFFKEYDCSEKIIERVKEFREASGDIAKYFKIDKKPEPDLKFECKNCSIFEECCGKGIEHHIFELPRISSAKFCQLKELGVTSIRDIPSGFELTNTQIPVYQAVKKGEPFIDNKELKNALNKVKFPAYYLDFETVTTAIPLYENIAPYEQIPTQYSIHRCSSIGEIPRHLEYLADPSRDCRRELAESLIRDCESEGSIFSYSSFEKTVINGLKKSFPDLDKDLEALTGRLVDLCAIFQKHYYHPDFHGSYSIKGVLPVMVKDLRYEGMPVANGSDAIAVYAKMARGEYSAKECKEIRKYLSEYCKLDTLAMVKLHAQLQKHNTNLWLLEMGWIPLLYTDTDFPLKLISECKNMKQAEKDNYVSKMICQHHTSTILNQISKSWEKRPCMSQRIHLLKPALQAHIEGNYSLSVTAILPQIEGLVAENFGHHGYMGHKEQNKYLEKLLKGDTFEDKGEILLKFITDIILSNFKHGDTLFGDLNRHAILHGADTSYDKESTSLKAVLFLDLFTRNFEYVALENSNIYHKPNCSLVKQSNKNRTFYTNKFQAEIEGRTSCKSCI